jgi:hypothetical protein
VKTQIALITGVCALLLLVAHLLGTYADWYFLKPQYDKFLHFLGGFFVFFVFVTKILQKARLPFTGRQLLVLIFFTLVVGILWEVFEYTVQHFTGMQLATIPDSIADVVFDNLGAVVAALMLFFVQDEKKRYNIANAER